MRSYNQFNVRVLFLGFAVALQCAWAEVDFNSEVRPILAKKCFACHGPDEESRQVNLRLDTRDGATGESGGYAGIIPGDSSASRLVARVTHVERPMPPVGAGERLTQDEVDMIRRWIDEGANYSGHWAFQRPARPELPKVSDPDWTRNAVDHFVLARLDSEGLETSREADRPTLIRRLSLDLIGLPPQPDEVEAFLADEEPGAYERVVNRLLNSHRYGERWARVWMDLARYADSQGYEKDNLRTIWPYRDWVIRALNANMPFDRFTLLQLAGDLLPVPTQDQLVATGFHRNTLTNTEGGTDDEEYRDIAVKDRIATTFQVWMGLTAGCAQCHSHKYDPISHEEFYQLYAFFNQTADADKNDDSPKLALADGLTTLVLRELPEDERRQTFIHNKGNFMDPGAEVFAATPAAFHSLDSGLPRNRLGLAKWLTDKRNPLTARVTVNRFWARIFGRGLVETEEDFGNQGSPPSHPLLLDWLATEFMRLDWDMKALLKTIVMSATYRQQSDWTPQLRELDPKNVLLARGARFRMDAEVVRDQMLALSGLLSEKMYGPPVMPWQPAGLWKIPYSSDKWITSAGEDRYRRALYTMARRTAPYPTMTTFDAPSGEVCTIRRVATNTPLQALATLNDPLALEAAQHFANRVSQAADSFEERLRYAFELAVARQASSDEIERMRLMFAATQAKLEADPPSAQRLTNVAATIYREDRLEWVVGGPENRSAEWMFLLGDSDSDWNGEGFDDSSWQRGHGMFGYAKPREDGKEPPAFDERIRTRWREKTLLLRREFTLPESMLEHYRVHVDYRGTFQVYLNGVLAAEDEEDLSGSRDLLLFSDAQASLRPGRNVVAVRASEAENQGEDRYIDVRLSAARPLAIDSSVDRSNEAAWVMLSHVLLNLDETLMRK